jgi:hypothetical protein
MSINEFEYGKTRIMAAAREELRRIGVEDHCVMFDLHGSDPRPNGATLTVTAAGNCVSSWFPADEIEDSQFRVARSDVKKRLEGLIARVREAVT